MERPSTTRELSEESRTGRLERSRTANTRRFGPRDEGAPRKLVLDRYRLERRLGAGGFGVVWSAFDEKLEREVAVKVIPRDDDEPVPQRAAREARVAARLNHPGIVGLYELASDDDAVYLVSELVPGRTLAELMRAGAVSDRDVARIGVALCDALAHAHARKVIHRDVKPQNVIVVAEPAAGAGFAKLADFGVAHLAVGDPLTRTGDVVGTLAYMAPEQAEGERVSFAADVYSLALTLYEGFTGANPVRGSGPVATARRLGARIPPLGSRRRDLPVGLCQAVDGALEPWPEHRPPLTELRSALKGAADHLSDEGGLVQPGTLERFGLTRTQRAAPALPQLGRGAALAARVGAGLAAGGLGLAALETFGKGPSFSPAAAAGVAALAVMILPRIGWIAAATALVAWLAAPPADAAGVALVLTAALVPVPFLLPRAGLLWSLPALAPLLGAIGLAPAFVAISGLAGTAWRRAGLAAAGLVWLVAAETFGAHHLLFGSPGDVHARATWEASASAAGNHALLPVLTSPVLAPAAVFAFFGAALPVLVRGRALALDVLGGAVWAGGLAGALGALPRVFPSLGQPDGAVAGALLGAALVVVAREAGLVPLPGSRSPRP
jgi:hypothetical protein